MDLYLLSPPFLRKMIRRPSSAGQEATSLPQGDVLAVVEGPQPFSEGPFGGDFEGNVDKAGALRGRRRSSLDRMLRQHAYIIICALCYACNTLPSHMT